MTQCRCQFLALPIAAIFGGLQIINNLCQNGVFHKQAKKSHYQNPYFLPSPVHLQDSQRWSSSFFRVSASFDVHGMNKITRRTIMIPAAIERPMIHSILTQFHQYSPFRYDRSQTTHIITNSKITGMGCRMKCYRAYLYMVIF